MKIRITAGDWGGHYEATSGRDAIKQFFADILGRRIKLCQLSPVGNWLHDDGELIPFRIAPALMLAGMLTMDEVDATLRACELYFTPNEISALARADAWMLPAVKG